MQNYIFLQKFAKLQNAFLDSSKQLKTSNFAIFLRIFVIFSNSAFQLQMMY